MEPKTGFEPATHGLQNRCSTTELLRRQKVLYTNRKLQGKVFLQSERPYLCKGDVLW